jgi:hypothetical protein
MATSCIDSPLAERIAKLWPRSKFAKEFRKLQLEKLIFSHIIEKLEHRQNRNLGSVEIAKELGVTPRTVRTYLSERRQSICGPRKIRLRIVDETGKTVSVDLLPLDQCAQKLGISTRELRRHIWMERRDRIAKLRAQYKPKAATPDANGPPSRTTMMPRSALKSGITD